MNTLVIVDLTPINKTILTQYSTLAAETLKPFGGKFIAKGPIEPLHGAAKHTMKAVIEFSSKEKARAWYQSEAYQAIIDIREQGMECQFHLV